MYQSNSPNLQRAIPFQEKSPKKLWQRVAGWLGSPAARAGRGTPNDETRAALVLAQAKELGLVSDDSPRFSTTEAAMSWLES